eukprot:scaffold4383_cov390-Prasinococcus_capsulatus_cf.AAC.8
MQPGILEEGCTETRLGSLDTARAQELWDQGLEASSIRQASPGNGGDQPCKQGPKEQLPLARRKKGNKEGLRDCRLARGWTQVPPLQIRRNEASRKVPPGVWSSAARQRKESLRQAADVKRLYAQLQQALDREDHARREARQAKEQLEPLRRELQGCRRKLDLQAKVLSEKDAEHSEAREQLRKVEARFQYGHRDLLRRVRELETTLKEEREERATAQGALATEKLVVARQDKVMEEMMQALEEEAPRLGVVDGGVLVEMLRLRKGAAESGKLRKRVADLEAQLLETADQVGAQKTRADLFQRQIAQVESDQQRLVNANKEVDHLRHELHVLQAESHRLISEAQGEAASTQTRNDELQQKVNSHANEVQHLHAEVARLKSALAASTKQVETLRFNVDEMALEADERQVQLAHQESELHELRLRSQTEGDVNVIESLRSEIDKANSDKEALMDFIDMLQEQVVSGNGDGNATTTSVVNGRNVEDGPSRLSVLQRLSISKAEDAMTSDHCRDDNQGQLPEVHVETSEVEARAQETESVDPLSPGKKRDKSLRDDEGDRDISHVRVPDAAVREVQELCEQLKLEKGRHQLVAKQKAELQNRLIELEDTLAISEGHLRTQRSKLEAQERLNASTRQELELELSSMRALLAAAETKYKSLEVCMKEELAVQEKSVESLQRRLSAMEQEASQAEDMLSKSEAKLQAQARNICDERTLASKRETDLHARLRRAEDEACSLRHDLTASRRKIEELQQAIQDANIRSVESNHRAAQKLQRQVDECERLRSQVAEMEELVSTLRKQLEKSQSTVSLTQEELKHEQAKNMTLREMLDEVWRREHSSTFCRAQGGPEDGGHHILEQCRHLRRAVWKEREARDAADVALTRASDEIARLERAANRSASGVEYRPDFPYYSEPRVSAKHRLVSLRRRLSATMGLHGADSYGKGKAAQASLAARFLSASGTSPTANASSLEGL